MRLLYDWNKSTMDLSEAENSNDIEFSIRIKAEPFYNTMKLVEKAFEDNDAITDVFVYTYTDHNYRVVVRKDYHTEFLLQLFKHRLLTKVEWME